MRAPAGGASVLRRLATIVLVSLLLGAAPPATVSGSAAAAERVFAEPEAGPGPLLALIAHARHGLEGETAALSNRPLLAGLEAAARRRIPVRLIVSSRPAMAAAHALAEAGVQVKLVVGRPSPAG